jgi:hypothetical protein
LAEADLVYYTQGFLDQGVVMGRGNRWAAIVFLGIPVSLGAQAATAPEPRVVSYLITATAPARWTVGARPLLEFGGPDGTGPTEFSKIVGVTRQSDGTIVVANGATRELRFFDARGQFLRAATRKGSGPGEIESLGRMFAVDDTLVVLDNRLKFHVYAPNGRWLRTTVLRPVDGYLVNPAVSVLSGFDVVVKLRGGISEGSVRTGRFDDARVDSVWLGRASIRDSSVRVLLGVGWPPSYAIAPGMPRTYALGFAPAPVAAATRGRICAGYPERYEVVCSDTLGRLVLRIDRATRRRPVTDSARRAFRDHQAGRQPDGTSRYEGSLRQHRERVAAAAQFVSHYPAYAQMLFARTGELWIRDFVTADGIRGSINPEGSAARSRWSIYDRDGKWIADCTLPAHFGLIEVGADYLIGVTTDEDDVERVTLLSLRR